MNIAVRFYASLFGNNPRPDCSFSEFKELRDQEQMRCVRRGVDLYTIELSIDGQHQTAVLESIAPKLTAIDATTVKDDRLIILCPGHDELGNRDAANQFTQLCQKRGLKVSFEVISHRKTQRAVNSNAYQLRTSAAVAAS